MHDRDPWFNNKFTPFHAKLQRKRQDESKRRYLQSRRFCGNVPPLPFRQGPFESGPSHHRYRRSSSMVRRGNALGTDTVVGEGQEIPTDQRTQRDGVRRTGARKRCAPGQNGCHWSSPEQNGCRENPRESGTGSALPECASLRYRASRTGRLSVLQYRK
jgi:hypothetical protein